MNSIIRNWRTSLCGVALIVFGVDACLKGWLTLEQCTPWIITGVGLITARDASSVDWQALVRQTLQARQQQVKSTTSLDPIQPKETDPK